MNTKTEIEWISADDELPPPNTKILALLPRMCIFGRKDSLEIRQCSVAQNGISLIDMEDEPMDWEVETLMWWSPCPKWMESPGWRKT